MCVPSGCNDGVSELRRSWEAYAASYLSEESGVLALNRRLRHAGQVHVIRSACL